MTKTMRDVAKLLFLASLFSSLIIISYGEDTITTSNFLSNKNTIVSSNGTFELGFFQEDSGNWFLGIWYKKISVSTQTVVWTANRDAPLNDTTGAVVKVNDQGNLVLLNSSNNIIWSSNSTISRQNPVARLMDSGNLVLKSVNNDDPKNFMWQSFDHPTDTYMPGMKLGRNLASGTNRFISSGNYTFELDVGGFPQLFLREDSVDNFRSDPLNGLRFGGMPGSKPNPYYTYSFVFNQEEVYYIYELADTSVYTRIVLDKTGVLQQYTWNNQTLKWDRQSDAPRDDCDSYGLCHGYGTCNINNSPACVCLNKFQPKNTKTWDIADWSSGCVREKPLDCKSDGFIEYSGIKLPDTRSSSYNTSITIEECRKSCLENCRCMAYANSNTSGDGSGCLLWFEDLIDIKVLTGGGADIYVRMASADIDSAGSTQKKDKKLEIGLISLAVILSLGLSLTLFYLWKKKKAKKEQQEEQLRRERRMGYSSEQFYNVESQTEDLELPLFSLATIVSATNNFSINNKLGEGGFGPVYKGKLEDGQEIAVKRLSEYSEQGPDEFKNEVICIAKLQHRNLVRLVGCCIEGQEKMLLYEYMPNNSLDSFLFDQTRSKLLDWPKRFNIINGTARGLLYLHQDSRLRIIHRDLKSANILLDSDMNPKISDFGMARSYGGNETEDNTKRVVGTYGYMSPEYAVDGIFSIKSDVFSFGVLVLEIVTGKRNRGFSHPDHHHNLLGHAWILHKENRSLELIDANLGDTYHHSEVLRSIHVGLLCVQKQPEDRPTMSSTVLMLGGEGALPEPKEPGFFNKRNLFIEPYYSSSVTINDTSISANESSITLLETR